MTIKLIPFAQNHVDDILENGMNNGAPPVPEHWRRWIGQLLEPGSAFSGIDNGHLVGAGGVIRLWDGVGEAWFLGGWRLNESQISAARLVRREFDLLIERKQYYRVQVAVLDSWLMGKRFVRFLGFKDEGLMTKYIDKTDYVRYAKVI